jgi:hypothetical protein
VGKDAKSGLQVRATGLADYYQPYVSENADLTSASNANPWFVLLTSLCERPEKTYACVRPRKTSPASSGWLTSGFSPVRGGRSFLPSSNPFCNMLYYNMLQNVPWSASSWLSWGTLCIKPLKTLTFSRLVSRWEPLKISIPRDSQQNRVWTVSAKSASQSV